MRRPPASFYSTANVAYEGTGAQRLGGCAAEVLIPSGWGLVLGVGVGGAIGCAVWLTAWAGYAVPLALLSGCVAFVVGFTSYSDVIVKRYAPQLPDDDDAELPEVDPVLLQGRKPSEVTPRAQLQRELPSRWAAFVQACAVDTDRRRLEKLGYGRPLVRRWRTLLMRANCAKWRNAQNHRSGWELTATAESILGDEPLQNDAHDEALASESDADDDDSDD